MKGQVSHELEVNVPAYKAWEIFGTLKLANLVVKKLPHIIDKIEVHGDGGLGSVLKLIFPPGTPGFSWYKEKFTVIDNERRVKVAEVVEGGYLDMGFTLFRVTFQILEKGSDCCAIKSIVDYEVAEEHAANASSMVNTQVLEAIAKVAASQLTQTPETELDIDLLVFV